MKIKVLSLITLVSLWGCNKEQITESATSQVENQNSKSLKVCDFDERLNHDLENNAAFKAKFDENEAYLASYLKEQEDKQSTGRANRRTLTIKVAVNNIYRSRPLSMSIIERQIQRLNECFNGSLSTRSALPRNASRFNSGDTKIRFVLASTNFRQSNRIFNNEFGLFRRSTGGIDPTLPGEYVNIYVADLVEAGDFDFIGTAALPGGQPLEFDHIFLDNIAFGVGRGNEFYDQGKVIAHEMGHYLGLFHLHGRGVVQSCRFDDAVGDTPNSSTFHFGQPRPGASTTTCGSQDMYWNYMNVTNDIVKFMYTTGQVNRMRASLDARRGLRRNFVSSN